MQNLISCGIPYLDKLMGGVLLGDNVVWIVEPGAYFDFFLEGFLTAKTPQGCKTIYISFDFPPHKIYKRYEHLIQEGNFILVDAFTFGKGHSDTFFHSFYEDESLASLSQIRCIKDLADPGEFIATISKLQGEFKEPLVCKYVFDSLTGMQEIWGERDTLHFFTYTCPKLFELKALAYWPIVKEVHSKSFLAHVTHITQLVISLSFQKDRTCAASFVKMDGRPSDLLRQKHYYSFHDNMIDFIGPAEELDKNRDGGGSEPSHPAGPGRVSRLVPVPKESIKIGDRIRALRLEKQITQIELARDLGITPSALSQIENNLCLPSLQLFIEIARYFDESLDSFILGVSLPAKPMRVKPKKTKRDTL